MFGKGGGAHKQLMKQSAAEQREGLNLLRLGESGQLEPGVQSWLDQYLKDATTKEESTYANLGIAGSTAEAFDRAAIGKKLLATKYGFVKTEMDEALALLGAAGGNYQAIIAQAAAEDQALSSAIGNFAQAAGTAAAGGAGGGG